MKRWFSLALVVLFLVPAMAICASAAEVYDFYFMERPAMLDTAFDPSYNGEFWFYDGFLPEGNYMFQVYIEDVLTWASLDSFLLEYQVEDGICYCDFGSVSGHFYDNGEMTSTVFSYSLSIMSADEGDGPMSVLLVDGLPVFEDTSYFRMIYVGDLPSQGGFDSLLGDVSSFAGSCISFITKVADTITGSPLLLLTVGILFIGGCIGITGRLFSRR